MRLPPSLRSRRCRGPSRTAWDRTWRPIRGEPCTRRAAARGASLPGASGVSPLALTSIYILADKRLLGPQQDDVRVADLRLLGLPLELQVAVALCPPLDPVCGLLGRHSSRLDVDAGSTPGLVQEPSDGPQA